MSSKLNDNVNAGRQIRERSEARTRLGNDIERKDLYYHMMNTADPKTGAHFTPKELWVESMLLITAGTNVFLSGPPARSARSPGARTSNHFY